MELIRVVAEMFFRMTMMVNKVISQYLKSNKRLIVPGFGAFIHKDESGIVFVPFLKKDDGVLVSLVSSAYNVNEASARNIIDDYITAVRADIAGCGTYAIEGLGVLSADAMGVISLVVSGGTGNESIQPKIQPQTFVNKDTAESAPQGIVNSAPAPASRSVAGQAVEDTSRVRMPASQVTAEPRTQQPLVPVAPTSAQTAQRPQVTPEPRTVQRPAEAPEPRMVQRPPVTPEARTAQRPVETGAPQGQPRPRPVVSPEQRSRPVQEQNRAERGGPQMRRVSPRPQQGGRPVRVIKKKRPTGPISKEDKADRFVMIAILAAIVALAAIIYGVVSSDNIGSYNDIIQPAQDTTVVTDNR